MFLTIEGAFVPQGTFTMSGDIFHHLSGVLDAAATLM